MSLQVTCDKCGKSLRLPDSFTGTRARCPGCKAVVRVEAVDEPDDTEAADESPAPEKKRRKKKRARKGAGFFEAHVGVIIPAVLLAVGAVVLGGGGYWLYHKLDQWSAAQAVGRLDSTHQNIYADAEHTLVKIGAPAVPALIEGLSHKEGPIRVGSARVLGKLGAAAKPAVDPLIKAVRQGQDGDLRVAAAEGLQGLAPSNKDVLLPVFLELANDPDHAVMSVAFGTLGLLADPKAVPVILGALNGSDAGRQQAALAALIPLGPLTPEVVPAVEKVIAGKDKSVAAEAIKTLGHFGARAAPAVPTLIAALKDDTLCEPSVKALGGIGPDAKAAVPALLQVKKEAPAKAEAKYWAMERTFVITSRSTSNSIGEKTSEYSNAGAVAAQKDQLRRSLFEQAGNLQLLVNEAVKKIQPAP